MHTSRCPAHCHGHGVSRRRFLETSALMLGSAVAAGCTNTADRAPVPGLKPIQQCGPASKVKPTLRATFVRRKEPYGMWWPGAVYDGEAARKKYTTIIRDTAKRLGMELDLRDEPIHSNQEADAWVAEAKKARPDGLLVVLLDRQRHSWPTAGKAMDSGLPTIVYSPVGSSFTTNTIRVAEKPHSVIYATDDTTQLVYGIKMIHARAKMRATRCLVLRGNERKDVPLADLGMTLRYVPAKTFLDEYRKTETDAEIKGMADEYIKHAERIFAATPDDVADGIKSYVVARRLLEREECDAISMDCLGALGRTDVSLPCIAWSRMNDEAIPAACEADTGAIATHTLVQYLFDRPGFQQDPVAETARDAIIGAHCSCATRLNGFEAPPEPYHIQHHHGNRDAVPVPTWEVGRRVTSADILPGKPSKMLIAAGEVLENVKVPPAGGCVVSVMVKFDDTENVLTWPGF
ncbi:MAG: hypothetical protein R6X20_17225, partial [Phycisphaerae bacterium]